MRTLKEAVTEDNYNRWDKGDRMKKKVVRQRPEPKEIRPKEALKLKDIDMRNIDIILDGRRRVIKNTDGVRFIGFDIKYQTKDGKTVEGWMPEEDYIKFRRVIFREGAVNADSMEY